MHTKKVAALLLPILAVNAKTIPAKRDELGNVLSSFGVIATDSAADASIELELQAAATGDISAASAAEKAIETDALSLIESGLGTQTSAVSAFITTVSGTPRIELSSLGGPAVTIDPSSSATATFAGFALPITNGAAPLVSRPLLTGVAGALAAVVAGGAFMLF